MADGGVPHVAWINHRILRQDKELFLYAGDQRSVIASGEIGPADGAGKKRVADENGISRVERNAPWRVSGCMDHRKG